MDAVLLGHRFPTYALTRDAAGAQALMRTADGSGDYVHTLHAQALSERVILALTALKQGRVGKAREILEEANEYLNRPHHTR